MKPTSLPSCEKIAAARWPFKSILLAGGLQAANSRNGHELAIHCATVSASAASLASAAIARSSIS